MAGHLVRVCVAMDVAVGEYSTMGIAGEGELWRRVETTKSLSIQVEGVGLVGIG